MHRALRKHQQQQQHTNEIGSRAHNIDAERKKVIIAITYNGESWATAFVDFPVLMATARMTPEAVYAAIIPRENRLHPFSLVIRNNIKILLQKLTPSFPHSLHTQDCLPTTTGAANPSIVRVSLVTRRMTSVYLSLCSLCAREIAKGTYKEDSNPSENSFYLSLALSLAHHHPPITL